MSSTEQQARAKAIILNHYHALLKADNTMQKKDAMLQAIKLFKQRDMLAVADYEAVVRDVKSAIEQSDAEQKRRISEHGKADQENVMIRQSSQKKAVDMVDFEQARRVKTAVLQNQAEQKAQRRRRKKSVDLVIDLAETERARRIAEANEGKTETATRRKESVDLAVAGQEKERVRQLTEKDTEISSGDEDDQTANIEKVVEAQEQEQQRRVDEEDGLMAGVADLMNEFLATETKLIERQLGIRFCVIYHDWNEGYEMRKLPFGICTYSFEHLYCYVSFKSTDSGMTWTVLQKKGYGFVEKILEKQALYLPNSPTRLEAQKAATTTTTTTTITAQ